MALLSFAAVATAAFPALADGINIPPRKAGEWKIEMSRAGSAAPLMTMKLCLDANTDKALMAAGIGIAGDQCATTNMSNGGGVMSFDSACDFGKMKTKSHTEISGDFQSSYTMKITSDNTGGPAMMPKHSEMTQTATWTGECSGLKPGEMAMPNGMTIDALKVLKPGG
jgi:hypothetical protein